MNAKAQRGVRIGTRAPYGYCKSKIKDGPLVVDEEAAQVVKRIFAMCASGLGPSQIARQLREEKIHSPSMYAYTKYGISHSGLNTQRPYNWTSNMVADILENMVYLGHTVNMRYSSKSYKDKKKRERPKSEWLIFENTHEAFGRPGNLGYRSGSALPQTPPHEYGRAEYVLWIGVLRGLWQTHGTAPGAYHEAGAEQLHLPDIQKRWFGSNAKNFIAKAKRFTDMDELTPELLHTFVAKIIVYEKEVKYSNHSPQKVRIQFRDFDLNEDSADIIEEEPAETTEKADSAISLAA